MNAAVTTPLDVKLMHMTAGLLLAGFAVMAGVVSVKWVARLPVFDIAGITVTGDVTHNSVLNLRANVAPRFGGTFFTVDLAQVRAAFEAVPWVRQAVVRRDFPNRLRVQLQEHKAVAYWGSEDADKLINSFGEVFEANVGEVEQDMLPRLNGPEGQSAEVLQMYRTLRPLFDTLELPLEELELSDRGSWRAQLESGAELELGRGDAPEITARVQRFLKTVTQVASRYGRRVNALEAADLRHENGYAIKLRGVSTTLPGAPKK
ncbi:MAG: cell division protein FtsQ [Burkholderiales bacterium PBB4]|nr:MAG: cell division protein FtsQ [Burkholderiales bacterium PBB4]